MENITVTKIMVSANLGKTQTECVADAMGLAIKEWRNVDLTHNGVTLKINVNDMLASVTKV